MTQLTSYPLCVTFSGYSMGGGTPRPLKLHASLEGLAGIRKSVNTWLQFITVKGGRLK